MQTSKIKIPAEDGFLLSAILRTPKNGSKGFIQINGGTGLPKELYQNFSIFLTESGFTTLTFDCRGIGESRPKSLRGYQTNIHEWGYQDFTGVFNWVNTNFPNSKKIVIGHSMGGQLIGLMKNNHLIDQIFLISSGTGYWRDMSSPFKWKSAALWFTILPLATHLFGYAPAKYLGQGENLPKGITLDWVKWSKNPTYFEIDFGKSIPHTYFDQVSGSVTSIQISDDPLANKTTATKLLEYFTNTETEIERLSPADFGRNKIGHIGYFSKKSKQEIWPRLLKSIK